MPATFRRPIAIAAAIGMALPVAVFLGGSSQATPTLTIQQAQAQLAALQAREGAAAEAYDAGRIALTAATAHAATAARAVTAADSRLVEMERGIAGFARSTYTSAGMNPLDMVLGGGDLATVARRAGAVDQVARLNAGKLRAIRAQQVTLTNARSAASDQRAAATSSAQRLATAKASIDTVIAQEQQVLSRLQVQQRQALLAEQARQQAASRAAARAALATASVLQPSPHARAVSPATVAPQASGAPTTATPVSAAGDAAQVAVRAALSQQGKPYVYGAAGPSAYDCSGLVLWAYARAGISLPHNAAAQYGYGTHVPPSQLQPGDIVFFSEGGSIGHNGIYVGGGEMVDANHTGGWVGVRPLYSGLIGGTRL